MKITRGEVTGSLTDYLSNLVSRSILVALLALPYTLRVRLMGWVMAWVVGPLVGYHARVKANLRFVMPELSARETRRIARAVADNAGRTLIEIYSGPEFVARMRDVPFEGAGVEALFAARDAGKPVVLVTGHFGNYDVPRGVLTAAGYPMTAIYKPLTNPFFNEHYVKAAKTIGEPLLARTGKGFARMVRNLAAGQMAGILFDLHVQQAPYLDFFGKPARTPTSAAEMALKFDALLIPIYGVRAENGLDFTVVVDAPIPHTDPITMTQAMNDGLEALTRKHMGQWFWIHKRWKPEAYPAEIKAKLEGRG